MKKSLKYINVTRPLKDDELVIQKCKEKKKKKRKKMRVTDFVLERTFSKEHPKSEKKKNPASLANKATVSVSPKILQLHL